MKIRWGGQEFPLVDQGRLTLGEAAAIERRFRCDLADAGSIVGTMGALYVSIRRAGMKVTWEALEALSMDDLDSVLIPEPGDDENSQEEPDPPAPETPTSSPGEQSGGTGRSSAI